MIARTLEIWVWCQNSSPKKIFFHQEIIEIISVQPEFNQTVCTSKHIFFLHANSEVSHNQCSASVQNRTIFNCMKAILRAPEPEIEQTECLSLSRNKKDKDILLLSVWADTRKQKVLVLCRSKCTTCQQLIVHSSTSHYHSHCVGITQSCYLTKDQMC